MTEIIGSGLILAASTALGFGLAAEKRRRTLMAEGFLALVKHIEDSLPSLLPLEDILAVFDDQALRRYGVLAVINDPNSIKPCNKRLADAIELTRDDPRLYSVLSALVKGLGSTDYDKQLKGLRGALAALGSISTARRAELEKGEKCYKYLGVLAGAMAVILLI